MSYNGDLGELQHTRCNIDVTNYIPSTFSDLNVYLFLLYGNSNDTVINIKYHLYEYQLCDTIIIIQLYHDIMLM